MPIHKPLSSRCGCSLYPEALNVRVDRAFWRQPRWRSEHVRVPAPEQAQTRGCVPQRIRCLSHGDVGHQSVFVFLFVQLAEEFLGGVRHKSITLTLRPARPVSRRVDRNVSDAQVSPPFVLGHRLDLVDLLVSSRSTHHQGPETMLLSMCHLQTPRSKARRRLAWHFLFAPGPDLLPLVFMTVALARDGLWVPDESTSGSLSASISRTCWLFWTDNIWRSGLCCHNQNKPWWSLRVVATLSLCLCLLHLHL